MRGVKIFGLEIELGWRKGESPSLVELFDRLNERKTIIAMDEAQKLRGPFDRDKEWPTPTTTIGT